MRRLKKNLDVRRRRSVFSFGCCLLTVAFLSGCSTTPDYVYHPYPGRTAMLVHGRAIAPPNAPRVVHAAIAAGNRIAGRPYRSGGGHRYAEDDAYDCSGAVSYVLGSIGALQRPLTSSQFRSYGARGFGRWITIYAKRGHVFLVVAGLRFDTGWASGPRGPQWTTRSRPARDFVLRHPPGL